MGGNERFIEAACLSPVPGNKKVVQAARKMGVVADSGEGGDTGLQKNM